jgi:hypothetical protein
MLTAIGATSDAKEAFELSDALIGTARRLRVR